jgi:hypothetical protein
MRSLFLAQCKQGLSVSTKKVSKNFTEKFLGTKEIL